jgi:UDP-N-acetylmuramoylalanine--D-glutamate ligase
MASSLKGSRAIVLGLGRFGGGLGVARWLLDQGVELLVTDLAERESLGAAADELAERGAELLLGSHAGVDVTAADLLVLNPAVPRQAPLVLEALAAGVTVTSEVGLLMQRWPGPIVGVTGSNGKSTTVSLTRAVLEAAGLPALAGGNLGGSLLDRLAGASAETVAVLELSSFMLETLAHLGLGPDVAVITNITPNHLDRHGSFEDYRDAKAAVMAAAHTLVLNADDEVVVALPRPAAATTLWFGDAPPAGAPARGPKPLPDLGVDARGDLRDSALGLVLTSAAMPLPGRMNRLDLAAATLAAGALLEDPSRAREALPKALEGISLPPHRLELVAVRGGVHWVDDSVSTTPESTAASLAALADTSGALAVAAREAGELLSNAAAGAEDDSDSGEVVGGELRATGRCVLIAGGHDKGLDPGQLVTAAARHTRLVLTIGEQGARLGQLLTAAGVAWRPAGTLGKAVALAADWARKGDHVLLSPGYSSHDQFVHFAARGQAFRDAVAALPDLETLS